MPIEANSSAKVENVIAKNVPWLLGGAADLAPSTKTLLTFEPATGFQPGNYSFRNMHFGIREHAMSAIVNGMSLTKVRPFGATFFVFTDYMRGGLRLSARSCLVRPAARWAARCCSWPS